MRAAEVSAGREQVEGEDDRDLGAREMRRRGESRPGGSEKSKDERRHEPFDHEPRMRDIRIRDAGAEIKEHPERHSDDSEQRTGRKENPERLLAEGQGRSRRGGLHRRGRGRLS